MAHSALVLGCYIRNNLNYVLKMSTMKLEIVFCVKDYSASVSISQSRYIFSLPLNPATLILSFTTSLIIHPTFKTYPSSDWAPVTGDMIVTPTCLSSRVSRSLHTNSPHFLVFHPTFDHFDEIVCKRSFP